MLEKVRKLSNFCDNNRFFYYLRSMFFTPILVMIGCIWFSFVGEMMARLLKFF